MTAEQPVAGPGGVPASGAGPIVDLIAADPPPAIRSVTSDLLDQALAAPRDHRTLEERWVDEPGTFTGGHWEVVA
jgi:hypothetical protein